MSAYAAGEASMAAKAKTARQLPDEDGFITVTRGGRTAPMRQEEAQRRLREQEQKDASKEGLKDFYRFQSREERKRKTRELMEGMERDREKVRAMKGRRIFKVSRNRPNVHASSSDAESVSANSETH